MVRNIMKIIKTMIVDLVNSGSSVKDLSSEYGVSEVTIYAWIKKFSPIKTEDDQLSQLMKSPR
jgi:transposase